MSSWRASYQEAQADALRLGRPILVVMIAGREGRRHLHGRRLSALGGAARSRGSSSGVNAEFVPVWINIRTTPVPPFPFVQDILVTARRQEERVTRHRGAATTTCTRGRLARRPDAAQSERLHRRHDGPLAHLRRRLLLLDHRSGRLPQHARARAAALPSGRGATRPIETLSAAARQPRRRAGSGSSATSAGALTRGSGWVRDRSAPATMTAAPTGAFHASCSPRPMTPMAIETMGMK